MRRFVIAVLIFLYSINLQANRKDWSGAINDNWNVVLNWLPAGIPVATDSVFSTYGDNIDIPFGYVAEAKYVRFLHTVNNYGSLEIEGGKADIWASFYNYGSFAVTNSTYDNALDLDPIQNLDRYFYNYGDLTIDGATGDAINQTLYNTVINYSTGIIIIKNYSGQGFIVNSIENYGKIRLEDSGLGGFKLDSTTDTLFNKSCGKIINFNTWEVTDGLVLNEGAIRHKATQSSVFDNELVNYGIIEDIDGTIDYGDIINLALYISPYAYEILEGQPINIFNTISTNNFTCSGLYNDKELTSFAGPYNNATHKWTPNTNAVGDSLLYISLTDNVNACIDTLGFRPDFPVVGVNFWVGNSGAWTNPANWNSGVPTATEKVGIYNSSAAVWIPANENIEIEDLYLKGDFLVKQNASLTINDNVTDYSMYCDSCDIINNGSIFMNKTTTGIYVRRGSLINNNNIECDSTFGGIYITGTEGNTDHFFTNNGTILGTLGPVIHGINSFAENYGNIILSDITKTGIELETFDNYGNISIEGINKNVGVGLSDNLTNHPNGFIQIKSIKSGMSFAEVINEGQIIIDSCQTGMSTSLVSENLEGGMIKIEHSELGLNLGEDFYNKKNSALLIKNTGLGMSINGSFLDTDILYNNGYILVDSTTVNGIDIQGVLINQGLGIIEINHSLGNGITNSSFANSIQNLDTASISIYNCALHGMELIGTVFTNEKEAEIIIDTVNLDGLNLETSTLGIITPSYGTNFGKITLGAEIGANAIYGNEDAIFINNTCSSQIYSQAEFDFEGEFINYGLYSQLSPSSVSIYPDFLNTGIIDDPFHVFQGPFFDNQGIHVIEKTGNFEDGEPIAVPIINPYTNNAIFAVDVNWYLDSDLSQVGGSYDQSTNTLTPAISAIDSSTFYVQITRTNCSPVFIDTVSIHFTNPISQSCGDINWLGGTGSWTNTTKWDKNRLPALCDTVIITQTLDSIILNNPSIIELSGIVNYGNLLISNQSELHILQSTEAGLLNYNNIHNSGTIHILNSGINGYGGMDNSIFTNIGSLYISQSANHGLWMRNAIFDNKIGASVLIEDSTQDDMRLLQTSFFYQMGQYNGQ